MGLSELREKYSWPKDRPSVPEVPNHGWFCGQNMKAILNACGTLEIGDVFLELGAWLGVSTRYICEQTPCSVITIDHWEGSPEHFNMPDAKPYLPVLYDTFLTNCWHLREQLTPVRETTIDGIRAVKEFGIVPKVTYLDAAHDADSVFTDLIALYEAFPDIHVIGDDWTWTSVREGVFDFLYQNMSLNLRTDTTCYEIFT